MFELERRIEHLYRHLDGVPPLPELWHDVPDEAVRLAREGKKAAAIKEYRRATGVGLDAARRVIESIPRG